MWRPRFSKNAQVLSVGGVVGVGGVEARLGIKPTQACGQDEAGQWPSRGRGNPCRARAASAPLLRRSLGFSGCRAVVEEASGGCGGRAGSGGAEGACECASCVCVCVCVLCACACVPASLPSCLMAAKRRLPRALPRRQPARGCQKALGSCSAIRAVASQFVCERVCVGAERGGGRCCLRQRPGRA